MLVTPTRPAAPIPAPVALTTPAGLPVAPAADSAMIPLQPVVGTAHVPVGGGVRSYRIPIEFERTPLVAPDFDTAVRSLVEVARLHPLGQSQALIRNADGTLSRAGLARQHVLVRPPGTYPAPDPIVLGTPKYGRYSGHQTLYGSKWNESTFEPAALPDGQKLEAIVGIDGLYDLRRTPVGGLADRRELDSSTTPFTAPTRWLDTRLATFTYANRTDNRNPAYDVQGYEYHPVAGANSVEDAITAARAFVKSQPLDARVAAVLEDPSGKFWFTPLETAQRSEDPSPEIDGDRFGVVFEPAQAFSPIIPVWLSNASPDLRAVVGPTRTELPGVQPMFPPDPEGSTGSAGSTEVAR